MKDWVLGT